MLNKDKTKLLIFEDGIRDMRPEKLKVGDNSFIFNTQSGGTNEDSNTS